MAGTLVQLPPDEVMVVEEIRKLFHATDEDNNGRLSSDEIKNLMELAAGLDGQGNRTVKHPQEVLAFVQMLDLDGNNQIEEAELIRFMLEWHRENNVHRTSGISSEKIPTRHWIHANISMFFTQVDTFDYNQAVRRLFQSAEDFEEGLEGYLRGHPLYDQSKKQERLKEALRLMEQHKDPSDLERLQQQLYDADVGGVARAVEVVSKTLSLVEAFPFMEEKFILRHPILAAFEVFFKAPATPLYDAYGNQILPVFLRLNELLGHQMAPLRLRAKACQAMFYFLLGPGVPPGYLNYYSRDGVAMNMYGSNFHHFHPSTSLAIKQPLVRAQFLRNAYDLIVTGVREVGLSLADQMMGLQAIEWATKALGSLVEWDEPTRTAAIQAGFIDLLLMSVMDETLIPLARLASNNRATTTTTTTNEQLFSALRGSTYALAVLLGHTHAKDEPLVAWMNGAGSTVNLIDSMVRYINATNDASVNANCVLALQRLVSLNRDTTNRELLNQLLMGVATKQYDSEASAVRVLLVVFSAIHDLADQKKEVLATILRNESFNRIMPEILVLPMVHKKLVLMAVRLLEVMAGPEVARAMGGDHLLHLRKYIIPLTSLLQRDQVDVVRQTLNFFKALIATTPCTDEFLRLGLITAFTSVFARFKHADGVLANVYGIMADTYHIDLVNDSLEILQRMVKNPQKESFLKTFTIEDVHRFKRLHRALVIEAQRPGNASFLEVHMHQGSVTLTQMNQAAKHFLGDMCRSAQADPTSHAMAIYNTCEGVLNTWQDSLYTTVAYAEVQDSDENMDLGLRDRMPCLVKGAPVVIYATPRGWGAEPYHFITCVTVTLNELKDYMFEHFRVRCNLVVEDPTRKELSSDAVVKGFLTALSEEKGKAGLIYLEPINAFLMGGTAAVNAEALQSIGPEPTVANLIAHLTELQLNLAPSHVEAIQNFFVRDQVEGWSLTFRQFRDDFMPAAGMKVQNSWTKIIFDLFDEDRNGKLNIYEVTRAMAVMTDCQHKSKRAEVLFDKFAAGSPFLTEDTLSQALMKVDPDPKPETEYRHMARQMLVKYSGGAGMDRKTFVAQAEEIAHPFMAWNFNITYNPQLRNWKNANRPYGDNNQMLMASNAQFGFSGFGGFNGRGQRRHHGRKGLAPNEYWSGPRSPHNGYNGNGYNGNGKGRMNGGRNYQNNRFNGGRNQGGPVYNNGGGRFNNRNQG